MHILPDVKKLASPLGTNFRASEKTEKDWLAEVETLESAPMRSIEAIGSHARRARAILRGAKEETTQSRAYKCLQEATEVWQSNVDQASDACDRLADAYAEKSDVPTKYNFYEGRAKELAARNFVLTESHGFAMPRSEYDSRRGFVANYTILAAKYQDDMEKLERQFKEVGENVGLLIAQKDVSDGNSRLGSAKAVEQRCHDYARKCSSAIYAGTGAIARINGFNSRGLYPGPDCVE